MTDRTHKNRISDLESDLEQKKSENEKNSAKSRKLKNELKRQTDSIASSKSQVFTTLQNTCNTRIIKYSQF